MSIRFRIIGAALVMAMLATLSFNSRADQAAPPAVKNVVLVHGAWADGSSWRKIVPLLQAKGLHVVCVQNPLTSFADDVAATKRIVDAQDGPVILVGHSYGGAVITEAGNDPKVAALVYVAAFAPDQGQSAASQGKPYGQTPGVAELRPLADGFLVLSPKGVREDFAPDLSSADKELLLATQIPTQGAALGGTVSSAAWRTKPSWFVIASNDRMIAPDQQRDEAKAMNAKVTKVPTSHVAMLAVPKLVAKVIGDAASGKAAPIPPGGP
ncbi:alpha/beta fold hydrolase [Nevskia soli]|uniref:alpha/beta fold hydrolase n=1 Tax=Nevskia soli TaxID=418856 RepID=UPI0004A6BD7E|nr:alpha/beta hydrolase [Nevskia soli]